MGTFIDLDSGGVDATLMQDANGDPVFVVIDSNGATTYIDPDTGAAVNPVFPLFPPTNVHPPTGTVCDAFGVPRFVAHTL